VVYTYVDDAIEAVKSRLRGRKRSPLVSAPSHPR
jgi:hypothetical protein